MNNMILQFLSYEPMVYSALDRFTIEVDRQLRADGDRSVLVYNNSLGRVPKLVEDLGLNDIDYELVTDGSVLSRLQQVFNLFQKHRPRLVHAHFDDSQKVMVAVCALYFRVPLIVTNHCELSKHSTLGAYRREKGTVRAFLFGAYLRLLLTVSAKYLSVSDKVAQQFGLFAGRSRKSQRVYLGIFGPRGLHDARASRQTLGLPDGTFVIGNVSAVEYIKGFETIVEALRLLRDEYAHQDFLFCHIGGLRSGAAGDAYFAGIKERIEAHGLTEHVRWSGIRNDVIDVVNAFDVYVQPSRMEALATSVMEACANGLPVVAARVGGLPEIVADGENGYLIEKDDAAALAERLHRLMDPALRQRMGARAREVYAAKFEVVQQASETLKVYASVR